MKRRFMILIATMLSFPSLLMGAGGAVAAEEVENLVVLLTDYGTSDFHVGALEGSIYSANPEARISTITHDVPAFGIAEGSFILAQAALYYPPGAVVAADVDPGAATEERSIVLLTEDGKLFVGPDNGLFTDVMSELGVACVREICNESFTVQGNLSATFRGIGVYGPLAALLAAGMDPSQAGDEISDPVRLEVAPASLEDETLHGVVEDVDRWGNLITNIPGDLVERADLEPGDLIEIAVGAEEVEAAFGTTYADVPEGEWVALVGSSGRLEIAINMGSAADAVGVSAGSEVGVREI